jgi:hypothetical protein
MSGNGRGSSVTGTESRTELARGGRKVRHFDPRFDDDDAFDDAIGARMKRARGKVLQ